MTQIEKNGEPVNTSGTLPKPGEKAPKMTLTDTSLKDVSLTDFAGKIKILNVFLSLDTGTCANSVKMFERECESRDKTIVLNISMDLPFAHKRFCSAENIEKSVNLSAFRSSFKTDWRLEIVDSALKGLCSRAVIVLDESDTVIYSQQVKNIPDEPDYNAAIQAIDNRSTVQA
jgi:thioredoxin-dependent peroxiredoxin